MRKRLRRILQRMLQQMFDLMALIIVLIFCAFCLPFVAWMSIVDFAYDEDSNE
jgi:hypothetical protein